MEIQPLSAVCEDSDLESAEVSLGKVCSLQGLGMFTRFETSTKYSLLHAILIYCCDPAATGRSDFSARELTTSQKIAVTSAPNCSEPEDHIRSADFFRTTIANPATNQDPTFVH